MSDFDLTQFNNINRMLSFKLNNPPDIDYDNDKNIIYTSWCLNKYDQTSEQPHWYGPDYVVITYTYWHNKYECNFSPTVILGHDYDKDVRPCWDSAASYYKYDRDSDDDY